MQIPPAFLQPAEISLDDVAISIDCFVDTYQQEHEVLRSKDLMLIQNMPKFGVIRVAQYRSSSRWEPAALSVRLVAWTQPRPREISIADPAPPPLKTRYTVGVPIRERILTMLSWLRPREIDGFGEGRPKRSPVPAVGQWTRPND